jgi:hypothetical protein
MTQMSFMGGFLIAENAKNSKGRRGSVLYAFSAFLAVKVAAGILSAQSVSSAVVKR